MACNDEDDGIATPPPPSGKMSMSKYHNGKMAKEISECWVEFIFPFGWFWMFIQAWRYGR
jgi:hypothetical protein